MSTNTEHFNLIVVEGTDLVNPLTQTNPNWESIDEAMWNNKLGGVILATHLLSGSVHAITLEPQDATVFRFVATANYTVGQTFTVNGQQVTGLTTNGTTLSNNAFVVNQNVLCCLVGTNLTFYVNNNIDEAEDSKKLGGQLPEYYATAEQAQSAISTAQAAQTIAQGAQTTANQALTAANSATPFSILWTNPNPTASFTTKTVEVELTDVKGIVIFYNTDTSVPTYQRSVMVLSGCKGVKLFQPSTLAYMLLRTATIDWDSGSISFGNGEVSGGGTRSDICIPVAIYAVRI